MLTYQVVPKAEQFDSPRLVPHKWPKAEQLLKNSSPKAEMQLDICHCRRVGQLQIVPCTVGVGRQGRLLGVGDRGRRGCSLLSLKGMEGEGVKKGWKGLDVYEG